MNCADHQRLCRHGKDSYPFACLVDGKNERLYVSLWNKAAVAVIDLKTDKVVQTIPTEKHPTEMAFGPGEKNALRRLLQLDASASSIIKEAHGSLETINCAPVSPTPPTATRRIACA